MRKIYILLFGVAIAGLVTAQSHLELNPNPAYIVGNSSDPAEIAVEMVNNGPESQNYTWRRTVNDIPGDWFSFVCDPNLCYGPNTNEPALSFVLTEDNHKLKVTFSPNGYPGTGYAEVEVYSVTDSANYNAIGVFSADLTSTGFNSPTIDNTFSVYPNPANEVVNAMVSFSSDIRAIRILNIVGKEVLYSNWNASNGRMMINVNQLSEGIYFVQFTGEGGSILSTKKISIKH